MKRTFVICKPDAVERGLLGEIISRFERKGLKIVTANFGKLTSDVLAIHYQEHKTKSFFADLVKFMSRSNVMTMVIEGPDDVVSIVRNLIGATNPAEALPGTIRGDFGTEVTENLIHGSDSDKSAEREIKIFFPDLQ